MLGCRLEEHYITAKGGNCSPKIYTTLLAPKLSRASNPEIPKASPSFSQTYLYPSENVLNNFGFHLSTLEGAIPTRFRETYYEYAFGKLRENNTFVRLVENLDTQQAWWSYQTTTFVSVGEVIIQEHGSFASQDEFRGKIISLLGLGEAAICVWADLFEPVLSYVTYRFPSIRRSLSRLRDF